MKCLIKNLFLISIFSNAISGQELLINGDFSQHDEGWDTTSIIASADVREHEIRVDQSLSFTLNGVCYNNGSSLKAVQTVDVSNYELNGIHFSGDLRFATRGTEGMNFAALALIYLNDKGVSLGSTKIYSFSSVAGVPLSDVGWLNETNQNTYQVTEANWKEYRLSIKEEVSKIGSINPNDVEAITVLILDTAIVYG